MTSNLDRNAVLDIEVQNFLSLEKVAIKLNSLNVLVGPNGAGKTNVLKIFQFLGNVARIDLIPAIDGMGDFSDMLFRGKERKGRTIRLKITGTMSEYASANAPDEYTLSFWQQDFKSQKSGHRRIVQRHEEIIIKRKAGRGRRITLQGQSVKIAPVGQRTNLPQRALAVKGAATGLATLRKLGEEYEAAGVESLAQTFEQLRLFEIDVEKVRRPSRMRNSVTLRADAANLAPYLFYLRDEHPFIFEQIIEDVHFVLPSFNGFEFVPLGGSDEGIRLDIVEDMLSGTTPLARASYGTIRALALFAMLHDPDPPRLTCLEEIDHGLHPHALDRLVDRVREASARTQIILATHSPALVNRLQPSELIVVERNAETGSSNVFRPNVDHITEMQSDSGFGLGELWFSGSIGGSLDV